MKISCKELQVIREGLQNCIKERQALLSSPDSVYPEIKAADTSVINTATKLLTRIEKEIPKQFEREWKLEHAH